MTAEFVENIVEEEIAEEVELDVPEEKVTLDRNDIIKLVALIAMTLDHIGWVLFPDVYIFRLIGRIAFPLFAYQLGISYRHTHNKLWLAARLLLFGLISQPIFGMLSDGRVNVFFTLLYCLAIFWCCDHFGVAGKVLGFALAVASWKLQFMDNAFYGMLCAFGYYVFPMHHRDEKMLIGFAYQVMVTFLYCSLLNAKLQIYALAALIFILYPFKKRILLPKYVFYIYYPAHLFVLWGIQNLIG